MFFCVSKIGSQLIIRLCGRELAVTSEARMRLGDALTVPPAPSLGRFEGSRGNSRDYQEYKSFTGLYNNIQELSSWKLYSTKIELYIQ